MVAGTDFLQGPETRLAQSGTIVGDSPRESPVVKSIAERKLPMFSLLRMLTFAVLLCEVTAPARAAEADKLLPADTEFVITVNVRQILGTELLKKAGLEKIKEELKNATEVNDILRE